MRGRPLKEIQAIQGHKSFSMTLRYAHLSPRHLCTAGESLAGLTPVAEALDRKAQKRSHSVKLSIEQEVPIP
jgi:hypothetical protein